MKNRLENEILWDEKKSKQNYDNKCSVTEVILVPNWYDSSIILKTASIDRTIEKNWAWFLGR